MTFSTELRGKSPPLDLPSPLRFGGVWLYGFAAGTIVLAVGATYALDVLAPGRPNFFFFFAAVVASAWYAGAGPGWLSVVLSTLAVDCLFLEPIGVLDLGPKDIPWLVAFAVCSTAANALSLQRRRAEAQLRQIHEELERRVDERTSDLHRSNERLVKATAKRVRAEMELRKSQIELARFGRIMTVGAFTASIAHEINQPLEAVVANSAAARNWLQRDPPALGEVAASVDAVIVAGQRAADVISKIRSLVTRRAPELTMMDINGLVSSVFELTQMGFKKSDVVISFHLESNLPPIRGDRVQLQHVILNLLNNAIEAMIDLPGETAQLLIHTERTQDNELAIIIEDCGNGFGDADSTKIFEPFYSTKQNGMGMGLSICQTIVHLHGGKISAAPRVPRGLAFRVTLPVGASP